MNNFIKSALKWLIFALPAVALLAPSSLFFPFITGKNFVFRIAVELAFFLFLGLTFIDATYKPRWNILSKVFAVFVAIMFVADVFAINPASALWSNFERMEGFVALAHLFVYFLLMVNVLRDRSDWYKMLDSSIAVSVFMVFYCFLQLSHEAVINQGGVRVDGQLGNAAYLAVYLLFHVFFLVYLVFSRGLKDKGIWNTVAIGSGVYAIYYLLRISSAPSVSFAYSIWSSVSHNSPTHLGYILLSVAFILFVYSVFVKLSKVSSRGLVLNNAVIYTLLILAHLTILYYTATRGAILGLIGGVFVGAVYVAVFEKQNLLLRKIAFAGISVVVLIVGGFFAVRNSSLVQNSPVLSRFADISWHDKSQAREYVWPMAIKGFLDHPVLGWGQDGFIYVFEKHYVPEMFNQEAWFDRAHNAFLDWLIAGGLFGFLAYVSLYISALYLVWRSSLITNKEKAVLVGLLVAYAFQDLFIFDNLISYMLFALVLAMIASLNSSYNEEVKTPIPQDDSALSVLFSSLAVFAIVALMINYNAYKQNVTLIKAMSESKDASVMLEAFNTAFNYNSFGTYEARQQFYLTTSKVVTLEQLPADVKGKFAQLLVEQFDKQIAETPNDARPFLQYGDFLSLIGESDKAIELIDKAKALSPLKQQILMTESQAYFRKASLDKDPSQNTKGFEIMKEVYELSPQFDGLKYTYAQTLLLAKDVDGAVKILNEITDTSLIVDQGIMKSLIQYGRASDAVSLLNKEINRNPSNKDAYVLLADIYIYLKNKQGAISTFEKMRDNNPELKSEMDSYLSQLEKIL